jgi:hypothetical protein
VRRFRISKQSALEWAVILLLGVAGGLLMWAEVQLGLFDWVDGVVGAENRRGRADIYAAFGIVQSLLLGLVGAYKWRAITRFRLGAALVIGAVLTAVELRLGWLNWGLRDADSNARRASLIPLLSALLQALVALLPVFIATSDLSD